MKVNYLSRMVQQRRVKGTTLEKARFEGLGSNRKILKQTVISNKYVEIEQIPA